ncbi:MAG: cytochrome b/b6 domain-containing protein [Thiotrichales bacterium]
MNQPAIKVWDIAVRVFHWTLVVAFVTSYLTGGEETPVHFYSGYTIIGLIVFRILWGFVGSRYARFSDFVYSPGAVLEYLKSLKTASPRHYLGHNPAGGWMILALLASLTLTTFSGLKVYGLEGHGPLAQSAPDMALIASAQADDDEHHAEEGDNGDEADEELWEEIHEFFANLTLALVILHIVGVIVSSKLHRENLAKAMVTGRKRNPAGE